MAPRITRIGNCPAHQSLKNICQTPNLAPLPSGTVVGGYQIVTKVAAGGFGIVYLAEDEDGSSSRSRNIFLLRWPTRAHG